MAHFTRLWKVALVISIATPLLLSCRAKTPGSAETALVDQIKKETIGGADWKNPLPDTPATERTGAEHFQHHCQICHGLDGRNTGVPFASQMSPPVADLSDKSVQSYADGQLKWIIANGIRYTGMPGWTGILDDDEQWAMVNFIRHLPPKGSLGVPPVFQEAHQEHEADQEHHPHEPHKH